jgi:hypothetical protein
MLRLKSKTQFLKQECNTQNAIALLNYLKRIAPQQLMPRTQVFTNFFKVQRNFLDRKIFIFAGFEPGCSDNQVLDLTTTLKKPIRTRTTIPNRTKQTVSRGPGQWPKTRNDSCRPG